MRPCVGCPKQHLLKLSYTWKQPSRKISGTFYCVTHRQIFIMALRQAFLPSLAPWFTFYKPAVRSRTILNTSQQLVAASLSKWPIVIPIHFTLRIPSILSGLWESILRAVPKKKTSHRKKRQRFMAGKALKDVTSLNKCSACGNVKRAHLLCPYCVDGRVWYYLPPELLRILIQSMQKFNARGSESLYLRKTERSGVFNRQDFWINHA